ncbi:MAG: endonuclease III domain-containing protein [Candidatus Baldrarchaeia archaeon]
MEHLRNIIDRLENAYPERWEWKERDPFKILIVTIISQRTNWKNVDAAVQRLESEVGISPETLASTDVGKIAECIRVAGLYNEKSEKIKKIAQVVLEEYGGDLSKIISMPLDEARRELLKLPGIGPKTADVVLLFGARKPVFPVDTHITRISKRLGIVRENADYEEIRRVWEDALPPEKYAIAHILLIIHGRRVCKSQKPNCQECVIKEYCEYYKRKEGSR